MLIMAGSYYSQSETKLILNITDTGDDTLLDQFGAVANQHIDNILEIYDEKIPLEGTNVLNDIKHAANFYTAHLYRSHNHDIDHANQFLTMFNNIINGIKQQRVVDNPVYTVERHMGRRGGGGDHNHYFAEWT